MIFNELHYLAENTADVVHETSTAFYNDDLHPDFWTNGKFDTGIREKLLQITSDFIQNRISSDTIDDIQLTGSMANYNYTKFSDLDVHVLTDYSKLNDNTDLVKQALDGKRFVWNLRHSIIIRKHEVEMYFQDTHEPHIASGLFSLKHNKWIKIPVHNPPEIDDRDVNKKSDTISDTIHRLKTEVDKELSPEDAELYYKKAALLKNKIGKMRQAGLESVGEFSVENLAFKNLRNSGDIGILIQIISDAYGKIYSEQNASINEDIMGLNSIVNAIEHPLEKKKETIHGLSKYFDKQKKGPRTQKWGTGQQRLHQNMVPDMHKHDPTLIQKVEMLKLKPAGSRLQHVVSLSQLSDIMDQYSLKNLSKETTRDKPKHLGSTGIMIYWDRNKQSYCIEK